jgi:hypothetical protein
MVRISHFFDKVYVESLFQSIAWNSCLRSMFAVVAVEDILSRNIKVIDFA